MLIDPTKPVEPIVPAERVKKAGKILFVAHLAIGDFTYLHQFFKKFKEVYPTVEVDLWVDECRRSWKFWEWKHLESYLLYDWVRECSFFRKIYTQTYSWPLLRQSIIQAQGEHYPLIMSIATLRSHRYAQWMRWMAPDGFIVGVKPRPRYTAFNQYLDAFIPDRHDFDCENFHITDMYDYWFRRAVDLTLEHRDRYPEVHVPTRWQQWAREQLAAWKEKSGCTRALFINSYAKDGKRVWTLGKTKEFIEQTLATHPDVLCVVNVLPHYDHDIQVLSSIDATRVVFLTGEQNFFQIPAMIDVCDAVMTVETSIMHLARAMHTPLVAMMRTKNPEWIPFGLTRDDIIWARTRSSFIRSIDVAPVCDRVNACLQEDGRDARA